MRRRTLVTAARDRLKLLAPWLLATALVAPAVARGGDLREAEDAIDARGSLAKVKFLASDELEGRRAGTSAGRRASQWIFEQLAGLGLAPEFQPFEVGPTHCRNVVCVIPGAVRDEHVLLGAHYDHVGRGEDGNGIDFFGGKGEIHNGADDNASGSAALLEVAGALARYGKTRRTIVLVWFDGEERGLWGSHHYTDAPKLPLAQCVAMINMDMVGRLRRAVQVIGANSGAGLAELVAEEDRATGLRADFDPYMVPNSDHFSFYSKRVPVVFFCTGLHGDYHRPSDKWPTINAEGIARIARLALRTAVAIAEDERRFAYADVPMAPLGAMVLEELEGLTGVEALETLQRQLYGPVRGAFVHASALGGLAVGYVVPGSPAEAAGLRAGDRITRAGEAKIEGPFARVALLAAVAARGREPVALEVRRGAERLAVSLGAEEGAAAPGAGRKQRTQRF
jgi:hypothetical protein